MSTTLGSVREAPCLPLWTFGSVCRRENRQGSASVHPHYRHDTPLPLPSGAPRPVFQLIDSALPCSSLFAIFLLRAQLLNLSFAIRRDLRALTGGGPPLGHRSTRLHELSCSAELGVCLMATHASSARCHLFVDKLQLRDESGLPVLHVDLKYAVNTSSEPLTTLRRTRTRTDLERIEVCWQK